MACGHGPQTSRPARQTVGIGALSLATVFWGSTFVFIRLLVGGPAAPMPPSVLIVARFGLAALLFAPSLRRDARLWVAGVELGFWLVGGYATQAIGLQYTSAGRSAFITALYVVFTPSLAALTGRRPSLGVFTGAVIALAGTGLLCYDRTQPNRGDAWTVLAAFIWSIYILRLEHLTPRFAPSALTGAQLLVVALFAAIWVAIQHPTLAPLTRTHLIEIAYLGVAATALTTWLQTLGQRSVPGARASLLYATEPVWAAFFAWLFLGDRFGPMGWVGASAVLMGVLLSQLPARTRPPQAASASA